MHHLIRSVKRMTLFVAIGTLAGMGVLQLHSGSTHYIYSKSAIRFSNTAYRVQASPYGIVNPGFSCSVSAAMPHVSTSIFQRDGLTFMDTHTYIS